MIRIHVRVDFPFCPRPILCLRRPIYRLVRRRRNDVLVNADQLLMKLGTFSGTLDLIYEGSDGVQL